MEVSSVGKLCEILIYYSIQRCRMLDDLCRLSVVALKPCLESNPTLTRVSISDTGVGSTLEEFQGLRYPDNCVLASKWDGMISVTTTRDVVYPSGYPRILIDHEHDTALASTFWRRKCDRCCFTLKNLRTLKHGLAGIFDDELHHLNVNLKEVTPERRLTKLPSATKNGAKFSGTVVSLLTSEGVDDLVAELTFFLQKMLILKYPKVAIELLVRCGNMSRSEHDRVVLAIECSYLPPSATYIKCMKSGLENYVLRHGNPGNDICCSCFPTRDCLKVGSGVACCSGSLQSRPIVEAVIIISDTLEQASPSCSRTVDTRTEVLYFEDFTPRSISQSSLDALSNIKWKNYGLTLGSIVDQDGRTHLEWENLPPQVHIDIVLHLYQKQVVKLLSTSNGQRLVRTLARKAMMNALDELKQKNEGVLLSARALKICNYAPDLAKTIASLILSSNDLIFKGECCSLLGMQFQAMEENAVEHRIKERIISAIVINDKEPRRNRDAAASILFQDDCFQTSDLLDEEYEEGEEEFSSLDL